MVAIFIMSANLASLDFFKIKIFGNKGYDVIILVLDVTNKILSHGSNNVVDVVM